MIMELVKPRTLDTKEWINFSSDPSGSRDINNPSVTSSLAG
jgi:hypothetical protein